MIDCLVEMRFSRSTAAFEEEELLVFLLHNSCDDFLEGARLTAVKLVEHLLGNFQWILKPILTKKGSF